MTIPRVDVGLPPRPFLYTLDQIALLLDMTIKGLSERYVHFDQVSIGRPNNKRMLARDISDGEGKPDWRVAEDELRRWLRKAGFRIYDRTRLRD